MYEGKGGKQINNIESNCNAKLGNDRLVTVRRNESAPLPPLPSPLPFQRVRPANYTQTLFPIPPGRVKLRLVGVRRGEGGMTFFPPQAASAEACRWDRRKGRRRPTTTQDGCPGLRSGGWAGRAAPSHVRIGEEERCGPYLEGGRGGGRGGAEGVIEKKRERRDAMSALAFLHRRDIALAGPRCQKGGKGGNRTIDPHATSSFPPSCPSVLPPPLLPAARTTTRAGSNFPVDCPYGSYASLSRLLCLRL